MPGTFSQILLHIVFSTKNRHPWIKDEIRERLYAFVSGIVRSEKGLMLSMGGIEDHVHLYLRWRPDGKISDLVRNIKARSTKWIHETYPDLAEFSWQEGYSVFAVSKSQEPVVINYLANQRTHHKQVDFQAEILALLQAHAVEFQKEYVLG